MDVATWLVALGLAGVHLAAGHLDALRYVPRNRWLSFAGGVPTAFVFVELLPALSEGEGTGLLPYLLALAGLVAVLAAEHAAKKKDARQGPAAFAVGVTIFAALNLLLGHLLASEPRPLPALLVVAIAMALKFTVSDRAMAEDHKERYRRVGRWVLVAAFLAGVALGSLRLLPAGSLHLAQAFLTGGVVLAVVKEEIPAERQSNWTFFALGAALYCTLVLGARWLA